MQNVVAATMVALLLCTQHVRLAALLGYTALHLVLAGEAGDLSPWRCRHWCRSSLLLPLGAARTVSLLQLAFVTVAQGPVTVLPPLHRFDGECVQHHTGSASPAAYRLHHQYWAMCVQLLADIVMYVLQHCICAVWSCCH